MPLCNFLAENFSLQASMAFLAITTLAVLIATAIFVPSMPVTKRMTYGKQIGVLRRPAVCFSILMVIFSNGSVFGVFNYLTEYLCAIPKLAPKLVSIMLFTYGLCNIFGSILAGRLLSSHSLVTVKTFPFALTAIYLIFYSWGDSSAVITVMTVLFGILGRINANTRSAPEAPDFANGLFLTSANLGTIATSAFCGLFIEQLGIGEVYLGGIIFAGFAALIIRLQTQRTHQITVSAAAS